MKGREGKLAQISFFTQHLFIFVIYWFTPLFVSHARTQTHNHTGVRALVQVSGGLAGKNVKSPYGSGLTSY